jgi:hypothetical protein
MRGQRHIREKWDPDMIRAGEWARLGAGIVGLALGLTLFAPGVASADGRPLSLARLLTPPETVTAQYSCDLSAYQSGLTPVSVTATFTFPGSVQTLVPVPVTVTTTSVALPASVLSQLTGVVSVDLTGTVTAQQNTTSFPVPLSGQNSVSGTLTGLPAASAQTSDSQPLVFTLPGTGMIDVPASTLTFTPQTSAAALPAITCTTTGATQDIPVTVTLGVIGTKGPVYTCVLSALHVELEEFLAHIPMTVTESGNRTVGKTAMVRLVAGIGGPYPPGTSAVRFSADLAVLGAQRGQIALSEPITDLASPTTRASGKLRLTKAGTDRIQVPRKFKFTFNQPVSGTQVQFVLSFTIKTSPVPVGATLKVANGHQPHPSSSPTSTASAGQPQGGGTPAGAPDTGGGIGPGGEIAAAVGGLALMLSGAGLLMVAIRQRRRHRPG